MSHYLRISGCQATQSRIYEILQTPSGKIELASPLLAEDVKRLRQAMKSISDTLLLVGRIDHEGI
ncbi:hypothetical protein ACFOU2_15585 [Bacillus songklensis]|uniref:Uncharacterized protein n=1 Tax=Bacillus songklensis TaxID=1069116 RepID=A0ABV8B554_9BACI